MSGHDPSLIFSLLYVSHVLILQLDAGLYFLVNYLNEFDLSTSVQGKDLFPGILN